MKSFTMALWLAAAAAGAAPLRVAVLDFADQTGMKPDEKLGGALARGALADKGVYLVGKKLVGQEGFVLVDRRDLLEQMDRLQPKDMGEKTPTRPSFIHAAQVMRADAVLRGSLLSFSTGKQSVNQGGYSSDLSTLSLRVGLEALDAKDGAVIAAVDGAARKTVRQTANLQTTLGEEDILQLMEEAVAQAVPQLQAALQARQERLLARPTVQLSIKTDADPALIEIDGVLVGSTPLEKFSVYQGDHVLTVGKPGYQQVTKRILFEKDDAVTVPLLREKLTADELKQIYEKIQFKVIQADPGVIVHDIDVDVKK